MSKWWFLICFLAVALVIPSVHAETLKSNNFQVDESFIGGGGLITESSPSFSAAESIGDLGIGESSSANFQTNSGYTTTNDPALTFIVPSAQTVFNDLSATAAATATSTFSVINYTSFGYVVQIIGSPPSNGSHVIPALSSPTPSQAGTEQYGINLVANTSPVSVGANPNNGTPVFGYGVAASGYNTANNYKYANNSTIASAPKSSGQTIFTISYLLNATTTTPGGQYSTSHTLICTGTY